MIAKKIASASAWTVVITLAMASIAAGPAAARSQDEGKYEEARELYLEAQKLLNKDEYKQAAGKFEDVFKDYRKSKYAADALYWQAFALYKLETKKNLRGAASALKLHRELYSKARSTDDAEALLYRVWGQLAEMGDAEAALEIAKYAEIQANHDLEDHELEAKMAALHALMNMNSERAVPILEKILRDSDPAKSELRQQAIFMLAEQDADGSTGLMMDLARNDPDLEVRRMAVFWLAKSSSEEVIPFLEEMALQSEDAEVREHALFALAERGGERAEDVLRKVALDDTADPEMRQHAIFWLSRKGGPEHIDFLMDLYAQTDDPELKEQLLLGMARGEGDEEKLTQWFMQIIFDESEPVEVRQTALFWAGHQGNLDLDKLAKLYDQLEDTEMREQVIFALSRRGDADAFGLLLELVEKEGNPELRQQLIFWIGQSSDPRAEEYLLRILEE